MPTTNLKRCSWAQNGDALLQQYHDDEWGRPCYDDRKLFELLSLEIMQAGLSWQTVLNKRATFQQVFVNFDFYQVQHFSTKLPEMMKNPHLIRNRLKLQAIVQNAQTVVALAQKNHSLTDYFWSFVAGQPIKHHLTNSQKLPTIDPLAKQISQQMKRDGFKFVGPVIIYSFMQAAGLVNDHEISCYLFDKF
ncbi:DNA-3-methyladenine glycosylase I [Liquorilactobacillus sicerae]|uniref:DNA-3-methyladenine glycosylase I n=1 Tax=Liquorilactobacillus sicerae TaxID=1416943 RepID=UPI00248061AE|nr:DNA-3-methyladenine glycosylase I [Liquorilactobacillus sicerae]